MAWNKNWAAHPTNSQRKLRRTDAHGYSDKVLPLEQDDDLFFNLKYEVCYYFLIELFQTHHPRFSEILKYRKCSLTSGN